jgi:hypothetical protein
MAVKIEVKVFWVVRLCRVVVRYQHFRGPCCLHLHPEVGDSMCSFYVFFCREHTKMNFHCIICGNKITVKDLTHHISLFCPSYDIKQYSSLASSEWVKSKVYISKLNHFSWKNK